MFRRPIKIFLLLLLLQGTPISALPSYCDNAPLNSTLTTPDNKNDLTTKQIEELNSLVVFRIQQGLDALKQADLNSAIHNFTAATNIAPYDPMGYMLLIKTFITINEETMAYKILERSGRFLSDNDKIISSLYQSLKEAFPPVRETPPPHVSIAQFKDNKQCAVSYVFDDGEISVVNNILPAFEKYGFKTTLALNPGVIEEDRSNAFRGNWDDWRKAKANGHEIANHGTHHKALPGLTAQELQIEVNDSAQLIKEKTGEAPQSFIFPEDKSSPEVIDYVLTTHLAVRDHDSLRKIYDHLCIPVFGGKRFSIASARLLIDIAIMRKLWLIPQCHGLYEASIKKSFKAISPELLNDQLEYLKLNNNKIWVGRFIDVYKYLSEFKATKLDIKSPNDKTMLLTLTNDLDPKIFTFPLTVVIHTTPFQALQAKAVDQSNGQAIPVTIKGDQILFDAVPSGHPIEISWK